MIKHIVFFKIREEVDKEKHLNDIKIRLEDLNDKIDVIHHLEAGINQSQSPNASNTALYSEFQSNEDLNKYRNHPDHREVVNYLKKIVTETRVVDYEN